MVIIRTSAVEVSIQAVSPALIGETGAAAAAAAGAAASSANAGPAIATSAAAAPSRESLEILWFMEVLLADRETCDVPARSALGLDPRRLLRVSVSDPVILFSADQSASASVSPVRMRTAWSSANTKIF